MENNRINLETFILEILDDNKIQHHELKQKIINSDDIELLTKDLNKFIIINTYKVKETYGLGEVYAINYMSEYIGLLFENYHPKLEKLPEEIELSIYLLGDYRAKHLGSSILKEFSDYLLNLYSQFDKIVVRIEKTNVRSIKSALRAGFEEESNEFSYKRR